MMIKVINFESDIEDHVNSHELSELSDEFEEDTIAMNDEGALSLSINDISFSRDLNLVNIPQKRDSRKKADRQRPGESTDKGSHRVFREVQTILKATHRELGKDPKETHDRVINDISLDRGERANHLERERKFRLEKGKTERREKDRDVQKSQQSRKDDRRDRGEKYNKDKEKDKPLANENETAHDIHNFSSLVPLEPQPTPEMREVAFPPRYQNFQSMDGGRGYHIFQEANVSSLRDTGIDGGPNHYNNIAGQFLEPTNYYSQTINQFPPQYQSRGEGYFDQRSRRQFVRGREGYGGVGYLSHNPVDPTLHHHGRTCHYQRPHNESHRYLGDSQHYSYPNYEGVIAPYGGSASYNPQNVSVYETLPGGGPTHSNETGSGVAHLNPNAREFVPSTVFR